MLSMNTLIFPSKFPFTKTHSACQWGKVLRPGKFVCEEGRVAIVSSIYGIFMLPLFTTQSLSCDEACAVWIDHKTVEQECRSESGVADWNRSA